MSAYFSNLASQQDVLQTQYLMSTKLNSYESSDHLPQNMMYLNNTSASSSNPELFSGHDSESREEMMFIAPLGNPVMMQQLSFAPNYSDSNSVSVDPQELTRKMLHFQNADQNGLSLSLGNQVASSYQSQYDSELRTAEYLSFDLAGPTNNNNQHHQNHQMMSARDLKVHEETVISGAIYNSRYLKAAQELLDEVVNVHQALRHTDKSQDHFHSSGEDVKAKSDELSPAEKTELQNKMTKLLSMLEEVDRRYKQYCQQMQVIVASFEIVAGCGAGKSYTALARQTISRQFRSLRDSIKNQIQAVQQSLGEEGTGTNTNNQVVGISRLRYIDQQLRQQRALLQFGVMRQPWRPQRGLPETAVSVLRAWLFEHFLHPYPKDSEKIMLARQTGLTRGQVANWFINARVRLWKPMIEEMYKEEFADMEAEAKSSQEHVEMLKPELEEKGKSRPDFTARLGIQSGIFDDDQGAKMDNAYNFSMLGNQVSLALGLKHPMKGNTHSDEDDKVVDEADEKAADFFCLQDAMNQQERFSSPHLLSDFVL